VRALLGLALLLALAGSAAASESPLFRRADGSAIVFPGSVRASLVRIGLSGTIASEFSDGKPVRMSGTYRGRIGSRPR